MIFALGDLRPTIDPTAWVAPDANIIGQCALGPNSSVWFGATLRGDNELISLGAGSNIQENAVLHTDLGFPLRIGANCTIGHKAMLHGCTIDDGVLIGMGATVLNGAVIGQGALIGAGALITENKHIPAGALVVGSPGKVVRQLDAAAQAELIRSAEGYQANARKFSESLTLI